MFKKETDCLKKINSKLGTTKMNSVFRYGKSAVLPNMVIPNQMFH